MKNYFSKCLCLLVFANVILFSCASDDDSTQPVVIVPTVTTSAISGINQTTATSGGNVTADGGDEVISRGVCWAITPNPTIAAAKTTDAGTTGVFASSLTGLTASTLYYIRAYATNSAGTAYGSQVSFTTTATVIAMPTVTTGAATAITQTTASVAGNVTAAGGAAITERGICWATTQNPTTVNSKITATGTTGAFTGALTGLIASTTYYARAYATNSGGTSYGTQVNFTTAINVTALPTVTTAAAAAITQTTASVAGNVTDAGGAAITERGICWAATQNPTTANSKITATGTTGAFTGSLTGLTANTTYYARAYAINSGGTGYGSQVTFSTAGAATGGPVGGNAICDGTKPTVIVPITSSTGKIWMDRNLGASRAATSSKDFQAYGCLYQWGRGNDGHASITWILGEDDAWGTQAGTAVNGVTTTLSTSDTPPNALFIADQGSMPYDWRSPKNNNLWQGVSGINNPCPSGYRIPTQAEVKAEITAYAITGPTSAYNSILKLPVAGDRAFDSGNVRGQGTDIFLWTSTVDTSDSYDILIQSGAVYTTVSNGRAGGYSVRCIKN